MLYQNGVWLMEGYVISRLSKIEVERELHFIGLKYDPELSKMLKMSVFWFEGVIDKKYERDIKGRVFNLNEIIMAGLKTCADHVDFNSYLKKRNSPTA